MSAKDAIIRSFCWHSWSQWTDPFQGTWVHRETWDADVQNEVKTQYMTQRRACKKCGKVVYRKCT